MRTAALAGCLFTALAATSFGGDVYVALGGTGDQSGSGWENAAPDIAAGIAAASEGDTVWIANGVYAVAAPIALDKALTLRGASGNPADVVISGGGTARCLAISAAGAAVEDLTIADGKTASGTTGAVELKADAALRRCVIRDNQSTRASGAAGLYMTAGVVDDCVFTNNITTVSTSGGAAGGAWVTGGLVTNSLFINNRTGETGTYDGGAGAKIAGAGVVVADCRFVGNSGRTGAGLTLTAFDRVERCHFVSNVVVYSGGAIYQNGGAGVIESCVFDGNYTTTANDSHGGGAIFFGSVSAKVFNCAFTNNSAKTSPGGTIRANSTLLCTNSVFTGSSGGHGGAVYTGSAVEFADCLFDNNKTTNEGGGGGVRAGGTAILRRCIFRNNSASPSHNAHGAGAFYSLAGGIVEDSVFGDNSAANGWGGAIRHNAGTLDIVRCSFTNNTAYIGGGAILLASPGRVRDSDFDDNRVTGSNQYGGGAISLNAAGSIIENCLFRGNASPASHSIHGGGAIYADKGGTIERCRFFHNSCNTQGGAIRHDSGSLVVRSCLFAGNKSGTGGALAISEAAAAAVVEASTFTGNQATGVGGGVAVVAGSAALRGNIVWGNTGSSSANSNLGLTGGAVEIAATCATPLQSGAGNIDSDPLFVDPGSDVGQAHVLGDYQLQPESPCINSGANQDWMVLAVDLDGNPRFSGGVVDMGAYETPFLQDGEQSAIAVLGIDGTVVDAFVAPSVAKGTDFGPLRYDIDDLEYVFTITNAGNTTVTLTGDPIVSLSGDTAVFTVVSQPTEAELAPGETTPFTIRFAPTALGDRTAQVSIANDVLYRNPITFDIVGLGYWGSLIEVETETEMPIPTGSAASTTLGTAFGLLYTDAHADRVFAIANPGVRDLVIDDITITGAGAAAFSLVSPFAASVVPPGGTTVFGVRFAPQPTATSRRRCPSSTTRLKSARTPLRSPARATRARGYS